MIRQVSGTDFKKVCTRTLVDDTGHTVEVIAELQDCSCTAGHVTVRMVDSLAPRPAAGPQPAPNDPRIFNRPGNTRPISEFFERAAEEATMTAIQIPYDMVPWEQRGAYRQGYTAAEAKYADLLVALKSWRRLWNMRPLDSGADIDQLLRDCFDVGEAAIARTEESQCTPS